MFDIKAVWNSAAKQISIAFRTPTVSSPIWTIHNKNIQCESLGSNPLLAQMYERGLNAGNPQNGGLYDTLGMANGAWYFGEVGDPLHGLIVTPGEPKLPYYPVGGEHYEIDSQVANSQSGRTINYVMHTGFWTVGHYARWGAFNDCWRTTLIEYRPKGDGGAGTPYTLFDPSVGLYVSAVYNYVYARGLGIVDEWWGTPDSRGNISGNEMYAIAWGKN
jgi:hypothetical protein